MQDRDGHPTKREDAKHERFEPTSNTRLEKAAQLAKQRSERTSTGEGIQMDESDEQSENVEDPMWDSLEPTSKVTLERARH
jgi:hypothetical protein